MTQSSAPTLADRFINLLAIGFVALGFFVAAPSAKVIYNVHMSTQWPSVDGVIVSSEVEKRFIDGTRERQEYRPRIWFSYTVNGTEYTSDRFSFIADYYSVDQGKAEQAAAKYERQGSVPVFYDPANPEVAVIEKAGLPWKDCVAAGIGGLLMVSGLVSFLGAFARVREQ